MLGHTDDHAEVIADDDARRSTTRSPPREPHNGYLILQGGLPEIEEFVPRHWK
ncbi:MAG: hypothetical protein MZV64_13975 [Ignavibacteriales bacterium]|nr:hypothetical protein [Ignavibacteriales bacterium]